MATERITRLKPGISVPPGELLEEELDARGLEPALFAAAVGLPAATLSSLIKGDIELTWEMALRLEHELGISARFWANLEASYREATARLGPR